MLALTFLLSQAYHHTRSKLQFLLPYLVDSPRLLFRWFPLRRSQLQLGNDSENISYTRSYFGGMSPHLLNLLSSGEGETKTYDFPFLATHQPAFINLSRSRPVLEPSLPLNRAFSEQEHAIAALAGIFSYENIYRKICTIKYKKATICVKMTNKEKLFTKIL